MKCPVDLLNIYIIMYRNHCICKAVYCGHSAGLCEEKNWEENNVKQIGKERGIGKKKC